MPDSLAPEAVKPALQGRFGAVDYLYVARCSSTQDLLAEEAAEGAVAVADEQTAGRGRLGRVWEAPAGAALLCSICVRPPVAVAELPQLTIVAAHAVVDAIAAAAGLEAEIDEPNDVLVARKKVAGVIAEAGRGRVLVGIGLNVSQGEDELPERPVQPATSLRLEAGRELSRSRLLVALLTAFERRYDEWLSGS